MAGLLRNRIKACLRKTQDRIANILNIWPKWVVPSLLGSPIFLGISTCHYPNFFERYQHNKENDWLLN